LISIANTVDFLGVGNIVDNCKGGNDIACAGASLEFAANFDPTGLATIASAFMHDQCDSIKNAEAP